MQLAEPMRVATGLATQGGRVLPFTFDGRRYEGRSGDTLASALLANGVRLVGRSFKYHRPRGIVTAGPEEPCALIDILGPAGREPNCRATTLALSTGLVAESQNRWPSLRFDALAVNDRLSRFLPAGFYYKTFMAPGRAWERLYEPAIRRAAGLGRLEPVVGTGPSEASIVHEHCDVLIVGAGAAGLSAALRLRPLGLRIILADQGALAGGGTLLDPRWSVWRAATLAALQGTRLPLPGEGAGRAGAVDVRLRTTVVGAYDHGVYAALTTHASPMHLIVPRETLHVIRARHLIVATGATERLIAFPGNDVPGVMLAGAALAYLRHFGVAAGRRPALFVNNDEAYEAAFALAEAGVGIAGIVDVRPHSIAAQRAHARELPVHLGAVVEGVAGRHGVRGVFVRGADGRRSRLAADSLLMSGGATPAAALATQLGAAARWHDAQAAFVPELPSALGHVVGAARGTAGIAAAAHDGAAAAAAIATALGHALAPTTAEALPPDLETTPLEPLWEVPGRGKAFVDLQNDVSTDDVRLAAREGYEHVEHMKRYTTLSMATDQGRIGGLTGSAVLAAARGVPVAAVGQPRPRPFLEPLPFSALAGPEVRAHYKPERRLPLQSWHESAGATFVAIGLWRRPLVYSRQGGWEPVLAEARTVRRAAGISDVSTLGKLDVQGPGAAAFLDFIYANTVSTLPVGRTRYGIMLREDGMLLDDGTVARLGPEHFLLTTTTANATVVLEHLEFHLEASRPELDVVITDVGDQWAQFAVAGPRSREIVAAVVEGVSLDNAHFPFMAAATAQIADVPGRLFRISFSGELAYELAVPAGAAERTWESLLAAGRPHGLVPYGLDALNTLRIEKGHVTGAELNGNTSADDLGMGRMLKPEGDFIGRALSARPGLRAAARLQLVGVRPCSPADRLRNGMHFTAPAAADESLGYVTSSTPAVESPGWVGLALLACGRARIGTRMTVASAVHGETIEAEILSPHMLDPENRRVRA